MTTRDKIIEAIRRIDVGDAIYFTGVRYLNAALKLNFECVSIKWRLTHPDLYQDHTHFTIVKLKDYTD